MTERRALWLLIVVTAALRLIWAGSLGLGNDEAYHYLFTVHRDWSYFDHPPMLAVVESLGLFVGGGSSSPFFLRLGFVLLFAGSTWLMARLTGRFFGSAAGFWAAAALNVSAYHTAAVGAFALPDGPLLFFWLLTLDRLAVAFEEPRKVIPWCWVGLAWGAAMLSKYHAVFLPIGALVYLILEPRSRPALRSPGPYLASLIGVACFGPVVYWNATHGWASFAFQGGRAVASLGLRPGPLLGAIVGQALYLFPWVWLALLAVLFGTVRRIFRNEASEAEKFLASQSVTPLLMFTAVACLRPVLPHWTLVGFLSAFPLLGRWCASAWVTSHGRMRRRAIISAAVPMLAAGIIWAEYSTGFLQGMGVLNQGTAQASVDPTADMYGWDQVARELDRRGLLGRPDTFLFTSNWYLSGQVGYATRDGGTPVLCYHPSDARSFGYWSKPEEWVGRTGILVSIRDRWNEADAYARFFERTEPIGEFEIRRAGGPIRTVRLFKCEGQRTAFPFGNGKRPPSPLMSRQEDDEAVFLR